MLQFLALNWSTMAIWPTVITNTHSRPSDGASSIRAITVEMEHLPCCILHCHWHLECMGDFIMIRFSGFVWISICWFENTHTTRAYAFMLDGCWWLLCLHYGFSRKWPRVKRHKTDFPPDFGIFWGVPLWPIIMISLIDNSRYIYMHCIPLRQQALS